MYFFYIISVKALNRYKSIRCKELRLTFSDRFIWSVLSYWYSEILSCLRSPNTEKKMDSLLPISVLNQLHSKIVLDRQDQELHEQISISILLHGSICFGITKRSWKNYFLTTTCILKHTGNCYENFCTVICDGHATISS